MTAPKKIIHEGRVYYAVGVAAKELRTTAAKVREWMGSGELQWIQRRANGRLLVSAESLVALQRKRDRTT